MTTLYRPGKRLVSLGDTIQVVSSMQAARAAAFDKTNLKAWWALEGLTDSHSTNTLTNHAGVTFVPGKVNDGADLEVDSVQYLDAPSNADLITGNVDYTIVCWAKIETIGVDRRIASKWASLKTEWLLWYDNASPNYFRFGVSNTVAPGFHIHTDPANPAAGTWYFIACGYDSVDDEIFMSVNDGTVQTTAYTHTGATSDAKLTIGGIDGLYNVNFDGIVDEFAFFKSAAGAGGRLTAEQITFLYNSGNGVTYSDL